MNETFIKVCPICGKEFKTEFIIKKYCGSKCQSIGNIEKIKDRRNKEMEKPCKRTNCALFSKSIKNHCDALQFVPDGKCNFYKNA